MPLIALWVRGSRGVLISEGAFIELILIRLFVRPSSYSTRFRRAVEGVSDSKEEVSVGVGPREGGVKAISLSTAT